MYVEKKRFIALVLTILIIISTSTLAADGCFLHKDSSNYCQEVSLEQAEQECALLDECDLEIDYQFGLNCNELQECETIYCQSSCQNELYGNCPYGTVPENDAEWCLPGCCRFEHAIGNYCETLQNKWYCEIEANNKGINQINWNVGLSEEECLGRCSETLTYQSFTLTKQDFSRDKPEKDEIDIAVQESTVAEEKLKDTTSIVSDFFTSFVIFFLVLIILLVAGTFFYKRYKQQQKEKAPIEFPYPLPKEESKTKPKKRVWLFNTKEIRRRLKILRKKHSVKVKEHELDSTFNDFSKKDYKATHLDKLKHLVSRNERKKARKIKRSKWHLEKVLEGEIKPKTKRKLTEFEKIEALEELRAILRKKKASKK